MKRHGSNNKSRVRAGRGIYCAAEAGLLYFPGLVCGQDHGTEVGVCLAGADLGYLFGDGGLVAGGVDVADDADGQGQLVAVHHGQLLVQEVLGGVGVVDEDVVDGIAVLAQGDGLEAEAVLHEAFLHVAAEEHLLALAQADDVVVALILVGEVGVDAVVEDDAVLEYLDHGGSLMLGGGHHDVLGVLEEDVDAACEEGAACAEDELGGDEGVLGGAVGGGLGDGAAVGGGGVLALGESVDLVVEQHYVYVDIAAHGVDEVVAADGQRVAVARGDPDAEARSPSASPALISFFQFFISFPHFISICRILYEYLVPLQNPFLCFFSL